jgi:hypothetical protein
MGTYRKVGRRRRRALGHATGGVIVWSTGLSPEPFAEAVVPSLRVLVYALATNRKMRSSSTGRW